MNYILSYIFSAIDFAALIILTLCLFRFQLKYHTKEIIVSSLIMSLVSQCFTILNIRDIAPVIQLLILIIIFKFIFKESLLYSFISNVLGFVLFMAIETALLALLVKYNIIDPSELGGEPNKTIYVLMVIESLLMCIVAFGMKKLNQGFGFSEKTINGNIVKTTNIYFVMTSSLTAIVIFILMYLVMTSKNFLYLTVLIFVLVILTSILIYLFMKRDREHYQ